MSTDEHIEFQDILNRFVKAGWTVIISFIVLAFGFGAWITSLEFRTSAVVDAVKYLEGESRSAARHIAEVNGNRYTASDHSRYASTVSDTLNMHDKRLTITEQAVTRIDKSLDRIETKLGTK